MHNSVHEISVVVSNPEGLHMRPAMYLVDLANQYDSDVTVSHGDTSADAKSILQVCMLAAPKGAKLLVRAQGPDAEQAAAALGELVNSQFKEAYKESSG